MVSEEDCATAVSCADGSASSGLTQAALSRSGRVHITVLALFWALIYVSGLFSPPLLDDADSVHAEAAREMLTRHDYVTLHANGVRYLDKAPLLYWLTAGSYKIFGFTEFATRLPLSLLVLVLLFATYALGKEMAGEKAGFCSALVLATAIGPYLYTRFLIPDIVVGLWLALTILLFWRSLHQERPSAALCWSIGILSALNVLTKGLIGMVFPVVIIVGFLLLTGNLKGILRLRPISTLVAFLAVAAPWHILAILRNPPQGESKGFFWFYFINEQLYRFLNKRIPHDYDRVPFLLFWGLLLVWLFPWSAFLVTSLRQIPLRFREWRGQLPREGRAALLLATWAIAILGFFSFSTRQEYYVLPALPALALLTGMWLAAEEGASDGSKIRKAGRMSSGILLALGGVVFVVASAIVMVSPALPPKADFAELLRKGTEMYTLSMGHLFDLTPAAMGAFRLPLVLTGAGLLGGTFLNWWFRRRSQPMRGNYALAGMMVLILYAVHLALGIFYPILGSKALANAVSREYREGDVLVCDGEYVNASSVNFYTGIQLHILNGRINGLWYGSLFPDSPKIFLDDQSFAQIWRGPRRVFFLSFSSHGKDRLADLGVPVYELMHSGEKTVSSNRAPLSAQSN